eukprot:CAMPEP_0117673156 /NCGR_PEP_ID=MMETSP0804-20121206/14315_1 /TAXON_ID=1074897 /ORGANISM="Tetraselmis astigmatica, Strain CCMP880" /LENGTH=412 /DNA_ID=CAMNT_0005481861 /DNA_START=21 /DNA_END=1259 /DNA_ORIENTATION=+
MAASGLCGARSRFVAPAAVTSRAASRPSPRAAQAPRRLVVRAQRAESNGALSVLFLSSLAAPAHADSVDDAVTSVTSGIETAGKAIKSGLGAVEIAAGYAKQAADKVGPLAKSVWDASVPVAKDAVSAISKAAQPAVKSVADKIPDAGQQIDKALSQQGINTKPVVQAGSQALESVKPAASNFFSWFLTQPLTTQAETILTATAAFYLVPPALRLIAGALQGYRGDLSAASALNTLTTDGKSVLVDIRRVAEKESSGDPSLPPSAAKRAVELEYSFTEDKKLRGLFANPDSVEAKITALKIAALKRTGKGSPLILLDKNGSTAKSVAKELAKLGYAKVYVIAGGFDGRNGWVQSKLQVAMAKTVSTATVVAPSILPKKVTAIPMSGTISGSTTTTVKGLPARTNKALPPPKK